MSKLTDALVDFRKGQERRDAERERAGLPTSGDIAKAFLGVVAPSALPTEPKGRPRPGARNEERSSYGVAAEAKASPVLWLALLGGAAYMLAKKKA